MTTNRTQSVAIKFANLIFGSAVILCIGVFIYAGMNLLFSYSNDSSVGNSSLFIYMAGALVGVVGGLVAFKLPENYRINLALMGISLFIGLYLLEVFLFFSRRAADRSNVALYRNAQAARKAGVSFDTRTILEVVLGFEKKGIDVVPHVTPSMWRKDGKGVMDGSFFPLAGVSQKTTALCNENGDYAMYESDEYGFNNPAGIFSLETIDLLLVGDSFTQGYCVEPEENVAGHLKRITGKNVINLGIAGNGPLLDLATLKEYGEPVRPEVVLWMFCERNDLENLKSEQTLAIIPRYLEPGFSQGLRDKQAEIDQRLLRYVENKKQEKREALATERRDTVAKLIKLWHLRMKLGATLSGSSKPSAASSAPLRVSADTEHSELSLFEQILKNAKALSSSWGGKLYFVYLPEGSRFVRPENVESLDQRRFQVISTTRSLDIPVIDIAEVFTNHPDPLSLFPFRLNRHYHKEGYRLIAQEISDYLESEQNVK